MFFNKSHSTTKHRPKTYKALSGTYNVRKMLDIKGFSDSSKEQQEFRRTKTAKVKQKTLIEGFNI